MGDFWRSFEAGATSTLGKRMNQVTEYLMEEKLTERSRKKKDEYELDKMDQAKIRDEIIMRDFMSSPENQAKYNVIEKWQPGYGAVNALETKQETQARELDLAYKVLRNEAGYRSGKASKGSKLLDTMLSNELDPNNPSDETRSFYSKNRGIFNNDEQLYYDKIVGLETQQVNESRESQPALNPEAEAMGMNADQFNEYIRQSPMVRTKIRNDLGIE